LAEAVGRGSVCLVAVFVSLRGANNIMEIAALAAITLIDCLANLYGMLEGSVKTWNLS
jgi:hypothetical protein